MVDISKLRKTTETTKVYPSNNLFRELGNNTYTFKDMISELIDNCIARTSEEILNVDIKIYYTYPDRKSSKFIITDNAKGISHDKLGQALSPAYTAIQTKSSLNEHGMGMKQAIAGIGELEYLATKVKSENSARLITELKFGDIDTYEYNEFPYNHGTEIAIKNTTDIVTAMHL